MTLALRTWAVRLLLLLAVAILAVGTGAAPAGAATTPPGPAPSFAASGSGTPASTPAAGTAGGASPLNGQRLSALNACLVSKKQGDVLLLLDKSGSIAGTDPTNQRIVAANALLQTLQSRLSDPSSELNGAKLDVAVTTFGDAVFQGSQRIQPADTVWTPLTSDSLPTLQGQVTELAPVHNGLETNYWATLDWVVKAMEAHAGTTPVASGCHMVFWFSDGMDFLATTRPSDPEFPTKVMLTPWTKTGTTTVKTGRDVQLVQEASEEDMRRAGGLSDRLRADGIVLVGIGLAAGDADPKTLDLMHCVTANDVVGDSIYASCGALPAIGAFFPVRDAADLLLAVSKLGSSDTPLPPDDPKPVCARKACSSSHTFALDSALRKVHVVGVASSTDPKVALKSAPTVVFKSPNGAIATLNPPSGTGLGGPTTATIGNIQLSYQWLATNAISVDMVRPTDNDNWTGTWSVTFIDTTSDNPNAVARIQVSLSADLALTPQNPPTQAQQEDPLQFAVKLTSLNGGTAVVATPAPPMTGTVTLTPATSGAQPITIASGAPDALRSINWTVPDSVPLGPATVRISLVVKTTTVTLDPVLREFDVTVVGPKGSPTLDTSGLNRGLIDFGSIQGTDPASASVPVVGPGCVWITSGPLSAHPTDVTGVDIGGPAATPDTCVTLAQGEHRSISVTATPAAAGNGQVRGALVVHLARQGHQHDASVASQDLGYRLDMQRKPAGLVKWLVFAGALVLGLGLPILVLWVTRRIAARFPTDVQLIAARVPVLVTSRALLTSGGGAPDLPAEWSIVPPPADGRRTLLVGGATLRAKAGPVWSPTAGFAQVQDRPGVGSGAPYYGGPNFLARLPLGVQGTWAILFRSTDDLARPDDEVAGDLLLISHPRTSPADRRTLLSEALSQGPGLVSGLRDTIRAELPTGPGSGPAGGAVPVSVGAPAEAGGSGGSGGSAGGSGGSSGAGGWGGPAGPAPGPATAPGWGSQAPPAAPGWGSQAPPAAPGWGAQAPPSGGQPAAPGWGTAGSAPQSWPPPPPPSGPGQGGWPGPGGGQGGPGR